MLRHREQDRREPFSADIIQTFPHEHDHLFDRLAIASATGRLPFLALQALGMRASVSDSCGACRSPAPSRSITHSVPRAWPSDSAVSSVSDTCVFHLRSSHLLSAWLPSLSNIFI